MQELESTRRSRFEIVLQILDFIERPQIKSAIDRGCNTDYGELKRILQELQDKKIVITFYREKKSGHRALQQYYVLSSKGLEIVLCYRRIKEYLE